ncbi:MAG: S41 family peptidase [Bacteroidota bacterium]
MNTLVKTEHFAPKIVDDSLSTNVLNLFLSQIDSDNRLFFKKDLKSFETDRLKIDDFIDSANCSFIDKYTSTLNTRIEEHKAFISKLRDINLDYSGLDTLTFKGKEKFNNFNTLTDVKKYLNKRIRYDIVYSIVEQDSSLEYISKNFKKLEKELKPKIIDKELCKLEEFQQKKGSLDNFVKDSFLNAFLLYQDPNSSYFSASEKNVFENGLSNNQLSFGIITAKKDNGDIVIAHIVPGSAAFKNSGIEENDIITALISEEKTLETYCVSNEDVLAFTNDDTVNTVTFRIKKPGGIIKEVKLTKEATKTEENTITGFVLNAGEQVGYINISSFYTDFESPNGLGVANDVAKELYKLQKEHIKGLIIDLRFNGGGSMKEAGDLSGMFINRGPLSILKYNNGDTFTIRDKNRGALFTKPIVVLVNSFSASASELFAGVMQDYQRAIIVGSPTLGKASAQVILPLDSNRDLGFSKLTVEKFYRITGQSHQSQGVIPDIILPSMYDDFETEEKYNRYALKNDLVPKTMDFKKLKGQDIEALSLKSKNRIENSMGFTAVKDLNSLIVENYFKRYKKYTLTLENIYNEMHQYRDKWIIYDLQMTEEDMGLNATNTQSTEAVLSYNANQKLINEELIDNINSDLYIKEANSILMDIMNQSKSNN